MGVLIQEEAWHQDGWRPRLGYGFCRAFEGDHEKVVGEVGSPPFMVIRLM